MTRRDAGFQTVRSEGGLLPPDLLRRVLDPAGKLPGVRPEDYGLPRGERLGEVIVPGWNRLLRHWSDFREAAAGLREDEAGTALTNDRWTLPLLRELGFGLLPASAAPAVAGRSWAIARFLGPAPVHLVGCHVNLDRRSPGVRGAARANPHGLVQEFLNRSDGHLWAIVSNGLQLRVLRDSQALSRQSFLEFDLEAMFAGEVYSDFVLLWLTAHATRFAPRGGGGPETCRLEAWTEEARKQGARALGDLRGGVERALRTLGQGLTSHPRNLRLRDALRNGALAPSDLHGQLLRTVYRLIFLFVAEDRTLEGRPLLHPPDGSGTAATARERYAAHYGTARLRGLAGAVKGGRHGDLWRQFGLVAAALSGDPSLAPARRHLALPALGGFLWDPESTAALNDAELANCDFLDALRDLAFIRRGNALRPVDYRSLGAEELGGVYESLLALTPRIGADGAKFEFAEFAGNERKTTGSYYTPDSLVQCLLDSALDPVVEDAVRGKSGREAEKAILELNILDPAVGSGHFLIGAARRLARRLARARAAADGEGEPSPLLYQRALRDVIGRCLYGVDVNPMAAELCRVGLWLEALEPGKPLSFLDRRIRVGDSLLGILDPAVMARGIPGQAYKALTGDDKAVCRDLKARNRRAGASVQTGLFDEAGIGRIATAVSGLDDMPEDTLADIDRKRAAWETARAVDARRRETLRGDLFTGAFLAPKTADGMDAVPLTEDLNRLDRDMPMRRRVERAAGDLALRHRYFHWPLEFPEVMAAGGFDVVLGNPPWERIKLQEKEFFAARAPEIARAQNKAARERLIQALVATDAPPADRALYGEFQKAKHTAEAASHFIRSSGRFPLTAVADMNTYALFAETFLQLLAPSGRAGIVVQSGIATDYGTRRFFREVSETGRLISLFDFENRERLFPGIDSRMRFCLLTLGAIGNGSADFTFFATNIKHLADRRRHFTLSTEDIHRINPNTRTMPVFRSRADAELTKKIYEHVPPLIDNTRQLNPWGVRFMRMFDMTADSELFAPSARLEGGIRTGDMYEIQGMTYMPLYEAKMAHQFDHRWATYDQNAKSYRDSGDVDKINAKFEIAPRYWVPEAEVHNRLADGGWRRNWLLGYRSISNATNERTVISSVIPKSAVGNSFPVIFFGSEISVSQLLAFLAIWNSLPLDYIARQKMGGINLNYMYMKQMPIFHPSQFGQGELGFIVPRVLELTYTSESLRAFAKDVGYVGSPFQFDVNRRAVLCAELDAFFAKMYGLSRDNLRFILDPSDVHGPDYPTETFRVLKKNEIQEFGEYRTQRLVLEAWDRQAPGSGSIPAPNLARADGGADTVQTFSVFCDESWRTTRGGGARVTGGAMICPLSEVRPCAEAMRSLKVKYGAKPDFEVKWSKVSPAKADFYKEMIDLFFHRDALRFVGAVAEPGTAPEEEERIPRHGMREELDRRLLGAALQGPHRYRIYTGVTDTHGGARLRRLRETVDALPPGAGRPRVERIQQIRARESELLQLADLLTGALAWANRGLGGNAGKAAIVARLQERFGQEAPGDSFAPQDPKFHVSTWRP